MVLDPEMLKRITVALNENDVDGFRSLLSIYPAYLRWEDGSDLWMHSAAQGGQLAMIQVLVELGLDINEPPRIETPGTPPNPYFQPEGPIVGAASRGHLEVVRWLLDQGAKINYVVHDKRRCLPLEFAAMNGHLEVVKLLVERGADLVSSPGYKNAVTLAEESGWYDVRDYLRSVGMRTRRESTPPDYASAHARFLKAMTNRLGPLGDWRLEVAGEPPVTLHVIPANEKSSMQTLFTVGLSDHPLPRGRLEHACTELRCMLPADWLLDETALANPRTNWPVLELKRLVETLRIPDRWPSGDPLFFMNGEPPLPLAPDTQLCGWMCLKADDSSVQAPDFRWIDLHSLFPIYAEEKAFIEASGVDAILERLESRGIPLHIDPQRPNMATSDST